MTQLFLFHFALTCYITNDHINPYKIKPQFRLLKVQKVSIKWNKQNAGWLNVVGRRIETYLENLAKL